MNKYLKNLSLIMVLNNKPQLFRISFPSTFFYDSVCEKWGPIINKMRLPYQTVADFMNSQIQSLSFPGVNLSNPEQGRIQYKVMYPTGKELEPLVEKTLNLTFKLTESYLSYWILWDQMDYYLHYGDIVEREPIWMEPISLAFINDAGFELTEFLFRDITPVSLSEINISYAATVASYNTFTWSLHYNVFEVK